MKRWEKILGFIFGVVLLFTVLYISIGIPQHNSLALSAVKIVLALASAGFIGIISGSLRIKGKLGNITIRAGGALAVFVIVYFFNPAIPSQNEGHDVNKKHNDYVGIWYSEVSDPIPEKGVCKMRGTTQLFSSYTYTYIGEVNCSIHHSGLLLDTLHHYRIGGVWIIEKDLLVLTIKSSKKNDYLVGKGGELSPTNFGDGSEPGFDMPHSYKILDHGNDYIKLERFNTAGERHELEFTRSEKPFTLKII